MTWVLAAVGAWLLCSMLTALVVGRSIRLADARQVRAAAVPDFIPADVLESVDLPRRQPSGTDG